MKASEESDSLPTDPEDEVNIPLNQSDFRQIFAPHRDCKEFRIHVSNIIFIIALLNFSTIMAIIICLNSAQNSATRGFYT